MYNKQPSYQAAAYQPAPYQQAPDYSIWSPSKANDMQTETAGRQVGGAIRAYGPPPAMLHMEGGVWDDQRSMSPSSHAARYGRRSNLSPDTTTNAQHISRHSGGVGDSTAEALGRVRTMIDQYHVPPTPLPYKDYDPEEVIRSKIAAHSNAGIASHACHPTYASFANYGQASTASSPDSYHGTAQSGQLGYMYPPAPQHQQLSQDQPWLTAPRGDATNGHSQFGAGGYGDAAMGIDAGGAFAFERPGPKALEWNYGRVPPGSASSMQPAQQRAVPSSAPLNGRRAASAAIPQGGAAPRSPSVPRGHSSQSSHIHTGGANLLAGAAPPPHMRRPGDSPAGPIAGEYDHNGRRVGRDGARSATAGVLGSRGSGGVSRQQYSAAASANGYTGYGSDSSLGGYDNVPSGTDRQLAGAEAGRSAYGTWEDGSSDQRSQSQQRSDGLSKLRQLASARLASRLTTPPTTTGQGNEQDAGYVPSAAHGRPQACAISSPIPSEATSSTTRSSLRRRSTGSNRPAWNDAVEPSNTDHDPDAPPPPVPGRRQPRQAAAAVGQQGGATGRTQRQQAVSRPRPEWDSGEQESTGGYVPPPQQRSSAGMQQHQQQQHRQHDAGEERRAPHVLLAQRRQQQQQQEWQLDPVQQQQASQLRPQQPRQQQQQHRQQQQQDVAPQRQLQQRQQRQQQAPARPPPRPQSPPIPAAMTAKSFGNNADLGDDAYPSEAEYSNEPKVQCPSCGRSFIQMAFERHSRICEKVFVQKRKAFNSKAARLEGTDAAKVAAPAASSSSRGGAAGGGAGSRGGHARAAGASGASDKPIPATAANSKSKWEKQSEQLRAAMQANKQIQQAQARGEDIRSVAFQATPEEEDDRVPCPHCGRKFAELVAERHIPKCTEIRAKPGRLKAGGGTGAHMRNGPRR